MSKTRGLVRVAELNDMELQNICVFGDADNDTCMVADAAWACHGKRQRRHPRRRRFCNRQQRQ